MYALIGAGGTGDLNFATRRGRASDATFEIGSPEVGAERGERFWITDRERTVVGAFRLPRLVGEDAALHALRRYLATRPDRVRLAETARSLGVWPAVWTALRAMEA